MSAKFKLSAWFITIIIILMAVMVMFVITVDNADAIDDAAKRLTDVVLTNEENFEFRFGNIDWDELEIYDLGVYCAFYDKNGRLINGATVEHIGPGIPFEEYVINTVTVENTDYYVYDAYIDVLDSGVWVRGVIPVSDDSGLMRTITLITFTLLPLLLLITVLGAVLIFRQVFAPMNRVIEAADSISEGSDLSARIGLIKAPSEMLALANTFDRMFDRLEKAFRAEAQFTSDASHELRTPITVIHAQCERSRKKDLSREDFLHSIEVIDEQSRKMSALVNQLLNLTRLRQGTDRYPMSFADLSSLTEDCCREIADAGTHGISLETNISPNIMATYNPTLISVVILNLLQNAYKYGRENGHILVSLGEDGDGIHLSVSDDGIGIADEDLDKIWNRFWQADSSRGSYEGAGLGLSLVKEIVTFHGGCVSASSVPNEGSTFFVTLPHGSPADGSLPPENKRGS